jgi:D-aminoacyl-tRNA deacylase
MLYTSEGLTFGLRPNALGLRSGVIVLMVAGVSTVLRSDFARTAFMLRLYLPIVFMKIVLQKVSRASVTVEGSVTGEIGEGYLLLTGIVQGDTDEHVRKMAEKVVSLRLFPGEGGKINDKSLLDVSGGALVVSQFTLAGKVEKGNRPDYTGAAERGEAERLYLLFRDLLREKGVSRVETGTFGAMMQVALVNEGPVTLIVDL